MRGAEDQTSMTDTTPSSVPESNRRQISRRTMLRGLGISMALPWLESIPVWGDVAPADVFDSGRLILRRPEIPLTIVD